MELWSRSPQFQAAALAACRFPLFSFSFPPLGRILIRLENRNILRGGPRFIFGALSSSYPSPSSVLNKSNIFLTLLETCEAYMLICWPGRDPGGWTAGFVGQEGAEAEADWSGNDTPQAPSMDCCNCFRNCSLAPFAAKSRSSEMFFCN